MVPATQCSDVCLRRSSVAPTLEVCGATASSRRTYPWHTLIRPENYVLNVVRLWLATLLLGQLNWPRLQRRASQDVARVPRLPTQVGSPAHDATPGFPREFLPRFVRREWLSLDYMPWHRNFIGHSGPATRARPPSSTSSSITAGSVLGRSASASGFRLAVLLE